MLAAATKDAYPGSAQADLLDQSTRQHDTQEYHSCKDNLHVSAPCISTYLWRRCSPRLQYRCSNAPSIQVVHSIAFCSLYKHEICHQGSANKKRLRYVASGKTLEYTCILGTLDFLPSSALGSTRSVQPPLPYCRPLRICLKLGHPPDLPHPFSSFTCNLCPDMTNRDLYVEKSSVKPNRLCITLAHYSLSPILVVRVALR